MFKCPMHAVMSWHRSTSGDSDEPVDGIIRTGDCQKSYKHTQKRNPIVDETFDSSAENFSPGNHPGERHQNEVASAISSWKEKLKENMFIVLLGSVAVSFLLGYFIAQQQEAKKREQWAEILFRQAKDWLTERGRKTAGSVQQGLEYARSAAEQATGKGAEYSRRLNPFHQERSHRFFGIL